MQIFQLSLEVTKRKRECLAGVLVSVVRNWLGGDGQRGALQLLVGTGGALIQALETGHSKLESW